MTLETDLLIDRRRLKRRLFVWRVVAVAAVLACAALAVGDSKLPASGPHVSRVRIEGMIGDNRKLVQSIQAVAKDDTAKALLVEINSPGGTVGGSEALYAAIREVAAKKPVVAVMGSLAASGGYLAAVAAPRIIERDSTITGSIGVMLQTFEGSDLLGKIGISAETLTSGPLKDQPSLTHRMTDAGRGVMHGVVMDIYDQFVEKVALGRNMDAEKVRALADGRVYTGRQALKIGLVDAIGAEQDARAWLASDKNVSAALPVRDIARPTAWNRLFAEDGESLIGGVLKTLLSQRVKLDGAYALWQPFDTNE